MADQTKEQVIEKLSRGWDLRNFGSGWFVCEPTVAYKKTASDPVSEEIYNALESEGLIECELRSRSAVARLKS